jgi:lipopolysaccharide export system protein LptA
MMRRFALLAMLALAATMFALPLAAQTKPSVNEGPPNAMQGFSKNKGQPVHIEAERLEVRDKDKVATFIGNVQVNQGDTSMHSKTLTVYYEGGAKDPKAPAPAAPVAQIGPSNDQKIKKLEARGDVVVTQNDQVATGDAAMFDMEKNVITMAGNVVLTQGQNVLRGNRLVVDMTTGFSRVESAGGSGGRVQGLFVPSGNQTPGIGRPADTKKTAPAR